MKVEMVENQSKRKYFSRNRLVRIIGNFLLTAAICFLLGACDSETPTDDEVDPEVPTVKDETPLIPDSSWDCSLPDGIPSPENGELVLEANMTIGDIRDHGETQYGRRHVIEITGGSVSGSDVTAEVLTGGLDYQLTLENGAMEIEQINVLKTSDDNYIYLRSCGASAGESEVRMVPFFEAADDGPYSFLNTGKYAGTRELDEAGKTLTLKIYDVSAVEVDPSVDGAIKVTQPDDVPDQSWDCQETDTGEKGDKLFSETVTLSPTITVGKTERGTRKIAPITGGTIDAGGQIAGTVLFGGADYQLFGDTLIDVYVDARYSIKTDDGELINIRNCGPLMPLMTLAPSFETRKDGNYSYLNDARWQSGFPTPNLAITQVKINIFEYPQ